MNWFPWKNDLVIISVGCNTKLNLLMIYVKRYTYKHWILFRPPGNNLVELVRDHFWCAFFHPFQRWHLLSQYSCYDNFHWVPKIFLISILNMLNYTERLQGTIFQNTRNSAHTCSFITLSPIFNMFSIPVNNDSIDVTWFLVGMETIYAGNYVLQ